MDIYLDNAATSFPKPPDVADAVRRTIDQVAGPAARSGYRSAVAASQIVDRCRSNLASLLGARSAKHLAFTLNGTDSLNLGFRAALRRNDHVIATDLDHNSVLRTLTAMSMSHEVETTILAPQPTGLIAPNTLRDAIRPNTRLVVLQHASNVTGIIQPILDLAEIARRKGVLTLVDAAQTSGHIPIEFDNWPIDLLAFSGHKGLLGPLGTGAVLIRPAIANQLGLYRTGGTGASSELESQPETYPERFESGNANIPGIAGLDAGIEFLNRQTVAELHEHEKALRHRLVEGLRSLPAVTLFGTDNGLDTIGVVSFTVRGFSPHEFASILDEHFSIQVRAGLHCAPRCHSWLGTLAAGGTIRMSIGPFTTKQHVDLAIDAVREIASAAPR